MYPRRSGGDLWRGSVETATQPTPFPFNQSHNHKLRQRSELIYKQGLKNTLQTLLKNHDSKRRKDTGKNVVHTS